MSQQVIWILRLPLRIHENGNTIIVVTHEPDIAEHCHRMVRLRDGLVETDEKNSNIIYASDPNHRYNLK